MTELERAEAVDKVLIGIESTSPPIACKSVGIAYSTFKGLIAADSVLSDRYARARLLYIDGLVAEMELLNSAPPVMNDKGNVDHGEVQLRKLRVDTIKWLLSKLAPKSYGDRITVAGDEANPLTVGIVERVVVHKPKEIDHDD